MSAPPVAASPMPHRRLGLVLATLGLGALLVGAWSAAQLRAALAEGPLLLAPFGLATEPDGTLLVGVARSRVHAYGPDGHLRGYWGVEAGGAPFRLRVSDTGADPRVEVATAAERLEYSLQGELLARRADPGAFERFGPAGDFAAEGPGGARFVLDDRGLVRVEPEPPTLLAPRPPAPLAWFGGRMLAVAGTLELGVVALLVGFVLTARRAARPASPGTRGVAPTPRGSRPGRA